MRTLKNVCFLTALTLSLLFLSCAKDEAGPTAPGNQPPDAPSNPSPANQAIDQSASTIFSWSCSDPDADDRLTYDVYLGTTNPPTTVVSAGQGLLTYDPPDALTASTTYFWKVIAKDSHGLTTSGGVWQFSTAAPSNQPPDAPSNPSPVHQAIDQSASVILSWNCSDPDANDRLTYDVYLGTANPPTTVVSAGQDSLSYDPPQALTASTTFYWKIIAKDNHGLTTSGGVWQFSTGNQPPNLPSNPFPAHQAIDQPARVTLSWICTDDDGDRLIYDVYLGTVTNPPLVQENISSHSYETGNLNTSTIYYWKIVAKDEQGHSTIGTVWSFTTTAVGGGGGNIGDTKDVVISGVNFTFAWIPVGSFSMGSSAYEQDRYKDEEPVHTVTFTQGFWMMTTEVTQGQWQAVMGSNPESDYGAGANYPVYFVSWDDIQEFEWKVGGGYSLPSEAEWEYACRAGTTTRFYWGKDGNYSEIVKYAWYDANSSWVSHPVGVKNPNAWGLYDMSGNVWEWCQDWYHDSYTEAPSDGSAWETPSGTYRALRGGSWYVSNKYSRSAVRAFLSPDGRDYTIGFRLVCR